MPKIVDHKSRKESILEVALTLFAKKGFQDVKMEDIAETCKISRPTLYQYFKNKEEIFVQAMKRRLEVLHLGFKEIAKQEDKTATQKLMEIFKNFFQMCADQKPFLRNIFEIYFLVKEPKDVYNQHLTRRTIKAQLLVASLLNEGVKNKELVIDDVPQVMKLFTFMIEGALLQMALVNDFSTGDATEVFSCYFASIEKKK